MHAYSTLVKNQRITNTSIFERFGAYVCVSCVCVMCVLCQCTCVVLHVRVYQACLLTVSTIFYYWAFRLLHSIYWSTQAWADNDWLWWVSYGRVATMTAVTRWLLCVVACFGVSMATIWKEAGIISDGAVMSWLLCKYVHGAYTGSPYMLSVRALVPSSALEVLLKGGGGVASSARRWIGRSFLFAWVLWFAV